MAKIDGVDRQRINTPLVTQRSLPQPTGGGAPTANQLRDQAMSVNAVNVPRQPKETASALAAGPGGAGSDAAATTAKNIRKVANVTSGMREGMEGLVWFHPDSTDP